VLEHVSDLPSVLVACHELLQPGGQLITTVPLVEMNRHLLLRRPMYAAWRARQLEHHNLWSLSDWTAALRRAGFLAVTSHPYLDGAACRFWDLLDLPGSLGHGRLRMGIVLRRVLSTSVPTSAKPGLKRRIARSLSRRTENPADGAACATLLVATKPAG